jgi:[acyl-carrier-protein] S-malonyltransferase
VRTALVFPGQGSQRPGMGAPWVDTPGWELVDQASTVLDRDLAQVLLEAGPEELRETRQAQVATFLVSLLALRSLPPLDIVAVAGHSLGEYSALVAAGVLTEETGLRLVAERGEAMQAAADAAPGTMMAVLGLADDLVRDACPEGVWVANLNAPSHVVISGGRAAMEAAPDAVKAAGARRVLPLPVGGAFHTPLMAPARERLDRALAATSYADPTVPVLANLTAQPYGTDVRGTLSAQLTAPVRWRQTLEALDVEQVLEVGPGGVLTGLLKRTRPDLRGLSLATPEDLAQL